MKLLREFFKWVRWIPINVVGAIGGCLAGFGVLPFIALIQDSLLKLGLARLIPEAAISGACYVLEVPLCVMVPFAVLANFQLISLQPWVENRGYWVRLTMLGGIVGWVTALVVMAGVAAALVALASMVGLRIRTYESAFTAIVVGAYLLAAAAYALGGTILGTIQRTVLRDRLEHTRRWTIAVAFSWALVCGPVVGFFLYYVLHEIATRS
jgi:hypothetical protein